MARTNFENLRIYRLSELIADEIWNIADLSEWLVVLCAKPSIGCAEPLIEDF